MLYSYYVYLYIYLKLPVSAPADPSGTAPLHRHTMSALPPVRSTATSGGVSSDRSGGDSPVVIHRDANGLFTDSICFYCTNFRTHYRCTALVPNGYFTLDLQRVCGRYFCHEVSQQWSLLDNQNHRRRQARKWRWPRNEGDDGEEDQRGRPKETATMTTTSGAESDDGNDEEGGMRKATMAAAESEAWCPSRNGCNDKGGAGRRCSCLRGA